MLALLARHRRLMVVRGIMAVLFGILALTVPGVTLIVLVLLFGGYALADGVVSLAVAFTSGQHSGLAGPLLEGLLGIGAGVLTFVYPGLTAISLLVLIAAWAILTGIAEIYAAIALRREITGEWRLGLAGVLSLVFGVVLLRDPAVGAVTVVWLIGIYAIVFGVTLFALGIHLRRPAQEITGA